MVCFLMRFLYTQADFDPCLFVMCIVCVCARARKYGPTG